MGRAFAGAQADDRAADADAFSRLQRNVADQPVAFIEQAEHGDTLFHRRHAGIGIVGTGGRACLGKRARVGWRRRRSLCLAITSGQRTKRQRYTQGEQPWSGRAAHALSGVHA